MTPPKLRPFRSDKDWKCPEHGIHVKARTRMNRDDDTGKLKFGGEYFACPNYPKHCVYYVSPGNGRTAAMVVDMETK